MRYSNFCVWFCRTQASLLLPPRLLLGTLALQLLPRKKRRLRSLKRSRTRKWASASSTTRAAVFVKLLQVLAFFLFGSTDVIGKNIKIDSNEIVHVSAVLKEVPSNSQFAELQYLFPWAFAAKIGYTDNNWYNSSISTFVELYPNATFTSVQQKLKDISKRHADVKSENFLKPMKESYLYNEYKNGTVAGGRIEMVRVFVLIAGFIVLIACINFMNLSTAQSERRAKEVGVRKVIGAQKSSLI